MKRAFGLALGLAVILSSATVYATNRVVIAGLYPDQQGQTLELVVPEGWTLVDTFTPPNREGENGHVTHGATYTYTDPMGRTHQVTITFCGGGE